MCATTRIATGVNAFKTVPRLRMQLQSVVGCLKRVAAKCVSDGENKFAKWFQLAYALKSVEKCQQQLIIIDCE